MTAPQPTTQPSRAADPAAAPTALEQSFAALCERHQIETISLSFHHKHIATGNGFSIYLHANGKCASGVSSNSLATAIGASLAALNAMRGTAEPVALADEPLPIGEAT